MFRKAVALLLGLNTLVSPALSCAATIAGFPGSVPLPPLATNTLPSVRGTSWLGVQSISQTPGTNTLVINQNGPQAIINWNSFNIGATAAVRFNQGTGTPGTAGWTPNSSYVALNRIYDQNPTLIFGKLSSDGKVYLINQNGILFGPNSQVDVHALTASTMNLRDGDFLKGRLFYTAENYQDPGYLAPLSDGSDADNLTIQKNLLLAPPDAGAVVANLGTLQTDAGGAIYLIAPNVQNYGSLVTPSGATRLVSALPLDRSSSSASGAPPIDLVVDAADTVTYNRFLTPGFAANRAGGSITADAGSVGLYGATVDQEGSISALTTLSQNGQISLNATDLVYTAAGSLTTTPVSGSKDTVLETSNFNPGTISLQGITAFDGSNFDASNALVNSSYSYLPLARIEHWGSLVAPSGQISLLARDSVYLGSGSAVDVSGVWVDEAAGANIITPQLNSVELNNDYGQKGGILQGQTVYVNPLFGTSIGDVSGSYTSRELTAQERSTTGGSITVSRGQGSDALAQLVVKDGATLNFSGGGLNYAQGSVLTTMLQSGTKITPLSSASEWTVYDKILTVSQQVGAYQQGSDAGTATLQARQEALDGSLNGSAVTGIYQTHQTLTTSDPVADAATRQTYLARGLETPFGGTLLIGNDKPNTTSPLNSDFVVNSIVVQGDPAKLAPSFNPGDPLIGTQTVLSASLLNAAGLSKLSLAANDSIVIDADAHLQLQAGSSTSRTGSSSAITGSSLTVTTREFDLFGSVRIPSGSVDVLLWGDIDENPLNNPNYQQVQERILIAGGASIDVSGQRVDALQGGAATPPRTAGGTITLKDGTDAGGGVLINKGALLDVSGGYLIDATGKVSGGNAGGVSLWGNRVEVKGDLMGLALLGSSGGELTLFAGTVTVGDSSAPPVISDPAHDPGGLYLSLGQLAASGFSQLSLMSHGNLTVGSGVDLTPSLARYTLSAGGAEQLVTADPLLAGATSVALQAGVVFNANPATSRDRNFDVANSVLTVAGGATVQTTPGATNSISVSAPTVSIDGELESLAGSVKVASTLNDLTVGASAKILAGGYNRVDTTAVGGQVAGWSPQNGGAVTLSSANDLVVAKGSLIDVSGSQPVTVISAGMVGNPVPTVAASLPGSLTLAYAQGLTLDGTLKGGSYLAGLQGGVLSLAGGSNLVLGNAEVANFLSWGFDDLTFRSSTGISFAGDTLIAARRLTLDSPIISAPAGSDVQLEAPWITLNNSSAALDTSSAPLSGTARLTLSADWIDLKGSVKLNGFQQTMLSATNDITLTDRSYVLPTFTDSVQDRKYVGELSFSGDLTLDAQRTYTTTPALYSSTGAYLGTSPSSFLISAADGTVTVLHRDGGSSTVLSAGGLLDIEAARGIDVQGTLLAPMGQIILNSSDGRVLLEPGSVVSTTGSSAVAYGLLDADGIWSVPNRDNSMLFNDVTGAPAQSIQLTGKEVIVQSGARVDASAGGSIFATVFQPGVEGSLDPRTASGRYVILPDNSVVLPGNSIYLAGGAGIAAGTYSLLPMDYASLPGARIVTALGTVVASGARLTNSDGNAVIAGYFTDQGTALQAPFYKGFTVQLASDVLKQGNFTTNAQVAGNGGTISLQGTTTVLNGSVLAAGLPGYSGGSLEVGGVTVNVGQAGAVLPAGFDFTTALPAGVSGTLISTDSINGKGFQSLTLGASGLTDSVTVAAGSTLEVANITISADRNITLEDGARLKAVGADGSGSVTLVSPGVVSSDSTVPSVGGSVSFGAQASIEAGSLFSLNVGTPAGATRSAVDLRGEVSVDKGAVSLTSDRITVVADADPDRSGGGIFLSQTQWNKFSTVTDLQLTSRSDLSFRGDFTLSAPGALSIDAQSISGTGNVQLQAGSLSLANSGAAWGDPLLATQAGTLALQADRISVGNGDLLFDGFGTVRLLAANDLTLQGAGSLKTGWSRYQAGQSMELQGAQILSALAPNGDGTFTAANFTVDAGFGTLLVTGSASSASAAAGPGGYLLLKGNQVQISGTVTVPAGTLAVSAGGDPGGTGGISLTATARLDASGLTLTPASGAAASALPGGKVLLGAGLGSLQTAAGSIIDVSGSGGSDAGAIDIYAPNGATLAGELRGTSSGGLGGSFTLESDRLDALSGLLGKLSFGGFSSGVDLRARLGDLSIDAGTGIAAREIRLTADSGAITVAGTLDASASGSGGSVELYAGKDLTVSSGAAILALGEGSGAAGGAVTLSSAGGGVFLQGGVVNLSGGQGGQGGTLTLRAPWIDNDTRMALDLSAGSIVGARQVVAEGVKVYSYGGNGTLLGTDAVNPGAPNLGAPGDATIYLNDLLADLGSIISNAGSSELGRLNAQGGLAAGVLTLRPDLVVRTGGDLNLVSQVILADSDNGATPVRFAGNLAGNLSLLAGGNLTVGGNITDAPTPAANISSALKRDPSWGITLTAGADAGSADPSATLPGQGTLAISAGARVYTESGQISFASGGDTSIGTATVSSLYQNGLSMPLTIGSYDGAVRGRVGGDLDLINGGVIQTATGGITIAVGGNLNLDTGSAIRTIGEFTDSPFYFWTYAGGGSVRLDVGKSVAGIVNSASWDTAFTYDGVDYWSPVLQPSNSTEGIVTLGGGDLSIRCGTGFLGQAGTFGAGNFTLFSGGDIAPSRFLFRSGTSTITADGSVGSNGKAASMVLEDFGSAITLTAGGQIQLGTVENPTLTNSTFVNDGIWSLTYGHSDPAVRGSGDASVRLSALAGDITITGQDAYDNISSDPDRLRVLPPAVELYAGGSIHLQNNFTLAPSPTGNLMLAAKGDIEGVFLDGNNQVQHGSLYMSDQDPALLYAYQNQFLGATDLASGYLSDNKNHYDQILHAGDPTPVLISAGNDLRDLNLFLPKQAQLFAGLDVLDILANFQNLSSGDTTSVVAGRDLVFSAGNAAFQGSTGIVIGGPGLLVVQAGRDIDLGTSNGITSNGNFDNTALSSQGSAVIVAAGTSNTLSEADEKSFFAGLRTAGSAYAELKAQGDSAGAIAQIDQARQDLIDPLFSGGLNDGTGSINMTNSHISTLAGQADLYLLARSEINVGKSTFVTDKDRAAIAAGLKSSGIFTASGGAINLFGGGDINVNESRVMSYLGGDITAWSDQGSLNAGRGSKTSINSQPPHFISLGGTPPVFQLVFTPPSAGSGVRALSYSQDASPGDVYLFAPQGVIDAGEAGIAGGKVTLGATEVLNAKNISFSAGSVGVPTGSEGSVSLGSLSGAGSVAENSKMIEQSSSLGGSKDKVVQQASVVDDFMSKWLDLRIISFDDDDNSGSSPEGNNDQGKKKKK